MARSAHPARTVESVTQRRFRSLGALGWLGICMLVGLAGVAIAGDSISGYAYDLQAPDRALEGPSADHWMGTDALGRDLASRLAEGARVSLIIAVASTAIALVIGLAFGGLSGYVGGRLDGFLMRVVDVLYSLPDILLIILIKQLLETGLSDVPDLYRTLVAVVLALAFSSWIAVARLVRGLVLQAREEAWVEAARAVGVRGSRILLRHILPNIAGPILVTLSFRVPAAILAESTVSFIGLGIQPPFASWGVLASDGFQAMRSYPYLILFPGLAIAATLLAFYWLGDALRDALASR